MSPPVRRRERAACSRASVADRDDAGSRRRSRRIRQGRGAARRRSRPRARAHPRPAGAQRRRQDHHRPRHHGAGRRSARQHSDRRHGACGRGPASRPRPRDRLCPAGQAAVSGDDGRGESAPRRARRSRGVRGAARLPARSVSGAEGSDANAGPASERRPAADGGDGTRVGFPAPGCSCSTSRPRGFSRALSTGFSRPFPSCARPGPRCCWWSRRSRRRSRWRTGSRSIENGRIRAHATPESLARDPEPLTRYVGVRRTG